MKNINEKAKFLLIIIILIIAVQQINLKPDSVSLEIISPHYDDSFQLFYDTGEGFNEMESIIYNIEKSETIVKAKFHKVPVEKIKNLRIDPGTNKGTILIKSIKINHEFHRLNFFLCLYKCSGADISENFHPANQIAFYLKDNFLTIQSNGNDPYIISKNFIESKKIINKNIILIKILIFIILLILILIFCVMSDHVKILFIAFILTVFFFYLQGNILFNPEDEGYLWYGTIETCEGKIPKVDFQAYDPGRYYWCAFLAKILGKGIISLRISLSIFQFLGLTLALIALRRIIHSQWILFMSGIVLTVWFYPRHKIFEHTITIAALYTGLILIEKPSLKKYFIAGLFVGFSAFFGRNHGLYNLLSFSLLILFIYFKIDKNNLLKVLFYFSSGLLIGYSPLLIMCIIIPKFFTVYLDTLLFSVYNGSNIPLPVPWPWIKGDSIQFFTGLFFLLIPIFYFSSVFYVLIKKEEIQKKALLVSGTLVGIPYMHHAFSRADTGHLAQAIVPFLLCVISLPFLVKNIYSKILSVLLLLLVCFMSYYSIIRLHPCYIKAYSSAGSFTEINILSDSLSVDKETANIITEIKKLNKNFIPQEEDVLIAPHWPGLYPVIGKKSPLWRIYFLRKEREKKQIEMLEELEKKHINWIILGDVPLDGRDDLRFKNTHNLIYNYIMKNFEPLEIHSLPENYKFYHRKFVNIQSIENIIK